MDPQAGRSPSGRIESATVPTLALAALCIALLSLLVLTRRGNLSWDDADYLRRGLTDARLASTGNPILLVPRALDRILLERPKPPLLVAWIELLALVLGRTNIDAIVLLASVVPFALLLSSVAFLARRSGEWAGFFALAALVASPRALSFGGKVMVETFLGLWVLLALAFAGLLIIRPNRRIGVALGTVTGLALLTKLTAVMLLAGALIPFYLRIARREDARPARLRAVAWAMFVCLAVAGPWYARNAASSVRFAVFSSRFNLVAEGNPHVLGVGERLVKIAADLPGWPMAMALGIVSLSASHRGRRWGAARAIALEDVEPALRLFRVLTCASTVVAAAVLLIPPYFDTRFLLPLWPALAVVVGGVVPRLIASTSNAWRTALGAGLAAGVAVSMFGALAEPLATTRWGLAGLIDQLVARHGVSSLANLGNIEEWNVCKTGLINELRRNPGDCFVLHDLSGETFEGLKARLPRFDAVVVLEPAAFPPGFLASAPGLNRGHSLVTERMLDDAGLTGAEDLPVADLPPMRVYVRRHGTAEPGGSPAVARSNPSSGTVVH
jgi:4-amino-4-deoxy-L-arabinose transferase-like glycosyltransferase